MEGNIARLNIENKMKEVEPETKEEPAEVIKTVEEPAPIPEPEVIHIVDKDSLEKVRKMTIELNKSNFEKQELERRLNKTLDLFTRLSKEVRRNDEDRNSEDLKKLRKDLIRMNKWDKESSLNKPSSLSTRNTNSIIASIMKDIHNERFEWSPLHFSAYHGLIEIVQFMIDEGHTPIETDNSGLSPLHLAVLAKRQKTIELLLKSGAKPNEQDRYGRTPLHYAVATDYRSVKTLLNLGADPIIMDHQNRSPIHVAAETGNQKAAEYLLRAGAKIGAKDLREWTVYHYASYFNKGHMITFFDRQGFNIDSIDIHKQTALHIASKFDSYQAMSTLLKLGASAQVLDSNGRSPLHNAASIGNLKMVNLLYSYNAIVGLPDNYKQSPLFYATKNNHAKVCKRLIQLGSNIKLQDFLGRTVFHITSIYGTSETIDLYINHPRYEDALDNTNRTPLDWAQYYHRTRFLDSYKHKFGK